MSFLKYIISCLEDALIDRANRCQFQIYSVLIIAIEIILFSHTDDIIQDLSFQFPISVSISV